MVKMSPHTIVLLRHVLGRVLQAVPLILAVIVLNFMIIHLAPGDPAAVLAGQTATPEWIEQVREEFGLNKPLHEQLGIYLLKVFQGDLGYSYRFRQPVVGLIFERVYATVLLMASALVVATLLGAVLGVFAARKPYSLVDTVISAASLVGYSLPIFWLGMLLVLLFVVYIPILPVGGMQSVRVDYSGLAHVFDILRHLILPTLALATWYLAIIFRLTRSSMLEVLREDYIVTARSKGLDDRAVLFKHALRNGLLPIITFTGMSIGTMLGGAVLTETVFSWPGLGRLMYDSLLARDYPVLLGMLIFISVVVIITNLVIDLIYASVDPRIAE